MFVYFFIILSYNFREGNDPDDYSRLTYRKLLEEVCRFANVLKSKGVTRGDRVAIYMPMILEVIITILACSRIGAVHTIVVCKQS
jgi:acetyl-CoA synthetase